MADEKKQASEVSKAAAKPAGDAKPAAKKKEKPPAIETKPLPEFMEQHCLPELTKRLTENGINDLKLAFQQQKIPVAGYESAPDCWQIQGEWAANNEAYQFNVYFFDETLQGQRGFSYSLSGKQPSTMESFRIDERRMSLGLFVSGVLQRLNSQKWLTRN